MDSIQELVSHVQSGNMDQVWAALYHELDGSVVTRIDTARAHVQRAAIVLADSARARQCGSIPCPRHHFLVLGVAIFAYWMLADTILIFCRRELWLFSQSFLVDHSWKSISHSVKVYLMMTLPSWLQLVQILFQSSKRRVLRLMIMPLKRWELIVTILPCWIYLNASRLRTKESWRCVLLTASTVEALGASKWYLMTYFEEERRGCPALRSLNIAFAPEVTDYSVLAIAASVSTRITECYTQKKEV